MAKKIVKDQMVAIIITESLNAQISGQWKLLLNFQGCHTKYSTSFDLETECMLLSPSSGRLREALVTRSAKVKNTLLAR